ncbi:anthrone oxygenase family protein [Ichthyenterobacterium sp. W332]|uniref:Anthrone oxygenase family protein n=1 Tax=Microcosmobacter mediterraneus TaxID=3075607 RepID=A0ABU2YHA1_9FLAO|nr:anthrone oxygenase family protein [Ichthyenterobacterium sp. W332]MDT0557160.1 anthrone oxygenase family protein [Ichthyenterobacterium sp. W332]
MKTIVFFMTVLLNALSTGFFFAWSVSVILGTNKVGHLTYLETMQNINREILNPVFFIVFLGSLVALGTTTFLQFNNNTVFVLVLASTIIYLIGTFGVTAFGNVPLNNELEALTITNLNAIELKNFRSYYESAWNYYHSIRTISSVVSFILLLISIFIQKTF